MSENLGLIVDVEARITKLERGLAKANATQRKAATAMEKTAQQNAKRIGDAYNNVGSRIGKSLAGLAGPLAAGISTAAIVRSLKSYSQLADQATQMRNSLKVAGLEGENLNAVYEKLYASAQANAAPISSLVDLYSKLSLTQKELGVNSDDLVRFTDGVAVALKVAGTDANAASGALLQLSQALGGGTVRAEEFNSILEGAPTIAQAVARGLKEAGGSVAELRKLVVDGEVSSQAFFRAFEAGSSQLRQQAATQTTTVGQAFTRLGNAMVTVAGKFDTASGASSKLAGAVEDLASGLDNFDADGFIAKIQSVIDAMWDAEEAGSQWLNDLGNSDFFTRLNEANGITGTSKKELDLVLETREAEKKAEAMEREIETLQAQIQNNTELGFDNAGAIARIGEVRSELAKLRAEMNNMSTGSFYNGADYQPPPSAPNVTTGSFYDASSYQAPPAAPANVDPVSITDFPASGSGGGGGGRSRGGSGGGGGGRSADDFQREVQSIRERTAAMQIEARVLEEVAASERVYADAASFAQEKARLLAAAQAEGKAITPELTAQIDRLAESYANAGAEAQEAAKKMEDVDKAASKAEANQERGADAIAGVFMAAREGSEAFADSLRNLADQLLSNVFKQLIMAFANSGAPGSGLVGGLGGALGGFASGGFTGSGGKFEPAGVVHRGEFVMSSEAVKVIGVGNLERLHSAARSGLPGFAAGGLVGNTRKAEKAVSGAPRASASTTQNISIAPVINMNAQGGDPQQNADLARQTAKETEAAMRGLVKDELIRQFRSGGMMSSRR